IIGDQFQFDLLAELSEKDEDDLEKLLSAAIKAFLIREERGSRGDDYRFYNAIIRRVLYEALSKRQRRKLHSRCAASIQKVHKGKLARVYGALAYHYNDAGEWQEAFEFGLKALEQALEQEAWSEVANYARWVEEAAAAINEAPEDYQPIDKLQLGKSKVDYAQTLLRLGNVDQATQQAQSALSIAEELKSDLLIARCKTSLCQLGWYAGRFGDAIKLADEGLLAAKAAGDEYSERHIH